MTTFISRKLKLRKIQMGSFGIVNLERFQAAYKHCIGIACILKIYSGEARVVVDVKYRLNVEL